VAFHSTDINNKMSTKRLLEENVDDSMSKKNKVSEELVLVEKPVSNQVILKVC
jgi:hypothetical protein